MNKDFKKGLFIGFAIYLIGTILTIIVHKITGWDYPHAPPVSFLVILLFIIIGLIRLLINAFNISENRNKSKNKGEIIIHLIIFGLILGFLLFLK
jgi:hypothetical protein